MKFFLRFIHGKLVLFFLKIKDNIENLADLEKRIFKYGLRPTIPKTHDVLKIKNFSKLIKLIEECWDINSKKRPSIEKLIDNLLNYLS
jgi:hypothetical protein